MVRQLKNGKIEYKKGLYKYNPFDIWEIPTYATGYFEVWEFVQDTKDKVNVYIIIGGRRLGKTFSMLRGLSINRVPHMYVRRTDSDIDNTLTATKNPYKAINRQYNTDIRIIADKKDKNIMLFEDDEPVAKLGIASSVSTSGSVRGADLEDVVYLLYDEFINLKPTNTIKRKEAQLFFDLYDTANNDRDIRGKEPLKAILLSNANTTEDGIIRSLNIGQEIYNMIKENRNYCYIESKKIYIAMLPDTNEITQQREKSAIGALINGTEYGSMAMKNNFVGAYFGDIVEKVNFQWFQCVFCYEDIYFYKSKEDGHYYLSKRKNTLKKDRYYKSENHKKFLRDWGMQLRYQYELNMIEYADYDIKLQFLDYIFNR